jgi:hypothetical protein
MDKFIQGVLMAVGGLLVVALTMFIVGGLLAWPIFWIWNYMMPELFDLPVITWWQAFWGNFLCGLLFKSSIVSQSK